MDFSSPLTRRQALLAGSTLAASAAMADGAAAQDGPPPGLTRSTLITPPYVTVETASGKLRGGHCRGALAFKGIPYGGPVSGANRFKPAPPVAAWTGVRDALALGTPAPQSPTTVYGEQEPHPGEDCLVLNVWTPAVDGRRRPVLFYNHGGGFSTGSAGSTVQDGGQLAANHDVVVVASNHRLGIFGYLYLREAGGDEYAASGNVGMLDILEALKWVQTNIAAFGGDPHNVTIFGESGGGAKTSALMAMPGATGLFHRAGVMSGPMLRVAEKEHAAATAHAVLEALNIPPGDLHRLADVPVERLLEIQSGKLVRLPGGFGPILDGTVISQHPFVPAPAPYVAHVPLLIGNNRDEATFFYWQDPEVFHMDDAAMAARARSMLGAERADAILPVYRRDRPNATPVELFIAIATSGMWRDNIAEAEAKVGQHGAPVYMYRFDYESNYPIKGTDWTLRAGHATEIQAKFENADMGGLMGTKPDRFQAARNFGAVWTSFARTGHPHAPGAPRWPAYDLNTRATMRVDLKCSLADDPDGAERKAWLSTAAAGAVGTVQAAWQRSDDGETILRPFQNSEYPHVSREHGHTYDGKLYDAAEHYSDRTVGVFIPAGYRPGDTVDYVVHFHGWNNHVSEVLERYNLRRQLVESGLNAILLAPQGPKDAPDSGGGHLELDPGAFMAFIEEATSFLQSEGRIHTGRVGRIVLSTHSGGYAVTSSALKLGGLSEHVTDVLLFDSSYGGLDGFTGWVTGAKGRRLVSIFTAHLAPENFMLITLLQRAHAPFDAMLEPDMKERDLLPRRSIFIHTLDLPHDEIMQKRSYFALFLKTSALASRPAA